MSFLFMFSDIHVPVWLFVAFEHGLVHTYKNLTLIIFLFPNLAPAAAPLLTTEITFRVPLKHTSI